MRITWSKTERQVQVFIQPEGYWSDTVTIYKGQDIFGEGEWKPTEINYGAGGTDGTQDSIATAITKAIALKQAAKIARNLDKRYRND